MIVKLLRSFVFSSTGYTAVRHWSDLSPVSGTINVGIPIHFHLSDDLNGHSGHCGQVRSGGQWADCWRLLHSTPPPPQLLRWDKEVMWNLTPTTPSLSLCLLPESVLKNGDQSGTGCHLAGAGGRVQVWHCTTVASSGDNGDDMSRDMLRVPVYPAQDLLLGPSPLSSPSHCSYLGGDCTWDGH